jgi:hypothetical protein
LFLHFEVAVQGERHLLEDHDLENYLTPLFGTQCLDPNCFALVTAKKKVGGMSFLRIGAIPEQPSSDSRAWETCPPILLSAGLAESRERKEQLRAHLAKWGQPIADGPVAVEMTWRCSSKRNWVNLWKPTGDAMAPILGGKGFNPRDDRIVALAFRHELDETLNHSVQVAVRWRSYGF